MAALWRGAAALWLRKYQLAMQSHLKVGSASVRFEHLRRVLSEGMKQDVKLRRKDALGKPG